MRRAAIPGVLLAVLAGPAAAQVSPQCSTQSTPRTIRAGGSTELVGDIVLTCSGATGAVIRGNIQIFLNVAVTSRNLASDPKQTWTEALLLIDDPAPASQVLNRNVFQAFRVSESSLIWTGVPLLDPETRTRVLRITNVRVQAPEATGTTPSDVIASLTISSVAAVELKNAILTVAVAALGAQASARLPTGAAAPSGGIPVPGCVSSMTRVATMRFGEGFATAFRARTAASSQGSETSPPPVAQNQPGNIYTSETGFYNPAFPSGPTGNLAQAGLADWGTRLSLNLTDIPAGVSVFVDPVNVGSDRGNVTRLITTDPNGAGGFSRAGSPREPVQLAVAGGRAFAVWEVLDADPATVNTMEFGIYLAITSSTIPPSVIRFSAGLSPGSSTSIPRFRTTPVSGALLSLERCSPPPTITSTSPLPEAIRGWRYELSLTGTGGVKPYRWSPATLDGGGLWLPSGLTLSESGVLSGTPTATGSQTLWVTLVDSGSPPAWVGTTLSIEVLPGPSFRWVPASGAAQPNQQPALRLSLDSAYRLPLWGEVSVAFQADPANAVPSSTTDVTFTNGDGKIGFQLPAGATEARFGDADSAPFKTGTTAGTITFSAVSNINNRSAQLVSPELPGPRLTIARAAPVLTEPGSYYVEGNSLYVCVTGYATGREVTQAAVDFQPLAGRSIDAPPSPFDVTTLFRDFYIREPSSRIFEFVKSYTVEGTVWDIGTITVRLSNSGGGSNQVPITLTASSTGNAKCKF